MYVENSFAREGARKVIVFNVPSREVGLGCNCLVSCHSCAFIRVLLCRLC